MLTIYSRNNCPGCDALIQKLIAEGRTFEVKKIGEDISLQDFLSQFPNVRTVPFVVDGEQYGS